MQRIGHGVVLRPETDADRNFLAGLFYADRAPGFAGWPEPSLRRLLDDQFRLQTAHYRQFYPASDRWIVVVAGHEAGRLYLDRSGPRWLLVDILLAPSRQGRGIGAALMTWLLAEAARAGAKAVELNVALDNPRATAFYRRFGFVDAISASATHRRMVRTIS